MIGSYRPGAARAEPGRSELQAAPVLLLGSEGPAGRETLNALLDGGASVIAVSNRVPDFSRTDLTWLQYDLSREHARVQAPVMVCASAAALHLAVRQARAMPALRRIVAVASPAVVFERHSPDPDERRAADELARSEEQLRDLCLRRDISLTLLRPTQLYGGAADAAFPGVEAWIERRGWFPITGSGLRQPVHAADLAALVVRLTGSPVHGTFELGGGERLAYPDFVRRLASAHGRDVRLLRLPGWLIGAALRAGQRVGRLREVAPSSVHRQRMDQVFDNTDARDRLGWNPRAFHP